MNKETSDKILNDYMEVFQGLRFYPRMTITENYSCLQTAIKVLSRRDGDEDLYRKWMPILATSYSTLMALAEQGAEIIKSKNDRLLVEEGDWSVVVIVSGGCAGAIGYYDDDGDRRNSAVVYPMGCAGYVEVPLRSLRQATAAEIRQYNETAHPVAKILMDMPCGPGSAMPGPVVVQG